MKFIDSTEIKVKAGDGGPGMVCFAAAFGAPKLGPDGGNGGNGGSVILKGTAGLNTLSSLRYKQTYKAEDGGKGGTNRKTGATGEDKIIDIPCGCVVFDADSGEKIGEVMREGDLITVAKGGWRGFGNTSFLSSTHQRPSESTPGKPGELVNLKLELKLLADVGLAGFPNAGKSTLLSKLSAAKPKIAGYPFTTLTPNLGVVDLSDDRRERSFVIADVPGLIEGAADGKGLGHAFLKHLERTKVVLHVIDGADYNDIEPIDALMSLRSELEKYSEKLAAKRILVAVNKIDLKQDEQSVEDLTRPIEEAGFEVMKISAVKSKGLDALKKRLYEMIQEDSLEKDALEERSLEWGAADDTSRLPFSADECDSADFNTEASHYSPVSKQQSKAIDTIEFLLR